MREIARLEGELEAAKHEAEKQKREQALAAAKRELERKQLEARYAEALPEIRPVLGPFVNKGYTQLAESDGTGQEKTTEHSPISYARLSSVGALYCRSSGMSLNGSLPLCSFRSLKA